MICSPRAFQFSASRCWNNPALLVLDPDDPDVRAILENDYIKNLLSNLRNYDTPGFPLTPEVKALRQLDAEASSDLSWWRQFFNPTFDLDARRFELSPLSSFLLEHPEFLLGPASLARQAVKTAACVALQRVAPKLLAASGAALAWENFVSFMKGGKTAVKKTTAGEVKPVDDTKLRVQSTKVDLDSFVKKHLTSGNCEKWIIIAKRQIYRFKKKCGMFKKGDLITKDTLHNEAEWWDSSGKHKGAVDPITGTKYKEADPTKHLPVN